MDNSLQQFRNPELSLWQSAVDQIVADQEGATLSRSADGEARAMSRPDLSNQMVRDTAAVCAAVERADFLTAVPAADTMTLGVRRTLEFCAVIAFKLARAKVKALFTGDDADVERYQEELRKFGQCDVGWRECVEEYVRFRATAGTIPYRTHSTTSDFVIDDRLPSDAKIALISDWGTGEDKTKKLLRKVRAQDPDIVIHLGDIYYSGTEHEVRNYFYAIWQNILRIPSVGWGEKLSDVTARPATFTLSGNHDMYAGGKSYYTLIDMLGQPASYFCLRNDLWQFIAVDTGYNDARPVDFGAATSLRETEVDWLRERVRQRQGRKTVLLSHHQLFSAYEKTNGHWINRALMAQVKDILPQVTAWFWGHEHDLIVYKKFPEGGNFLGRCLGHGAIPVGINERVPGEAAIPVEDVRLSADSSGDLFQNGYVILELQQSIAEVTYYQYDADIDQETVLFRETV